MFNNILGMVIMKYEKFSGLMRLQQLFQAFNARDRLISIDAKRIISVENAFRVLVQMQKLDDNVLRRILLDLPIDQIEQLIVNIVSVQCV